MGRMITEDAVLYILLFYAASSILYAIPFFSSAYPNMKYDTTSQSFVYYSDSELDPTDNVYALANNDQFKTACETYKINESKAWGMINPLEIVYMMLAYIGMILYAFSNPLLYDLLSQVIGAQWSLAIIFALNVATIILIFTMVTGRLRRD